MSFFLGTTSSMMFGCALFTFGIIGMTIGFLEIAHHEDLQQILTSSWKKNGSLMVAGTILLGVLHGFMPEAINNYGHHIYSLLPGMNSLPDGSNLPNAPNVHMPEIPNLSMPNMPNLHLPRMHVPNVHMPNVHMPNVHMPNMHMPQVPNLGMPNVHLPNVQMPSIGYSGLGGQMYFPAMVICALLAYFWGLQIQCNGRVTCM